MAARVVAGSAASVLLAAGAALTAPAVSQPAGVDPTDPERTAGMDAACQCISLWDPVCGYDGRTYSNECSLACGGGRPAEGAGEGGGVDGRSPREAASALWCRGECPCPCPVPVRCLVSPCEVAPPCTDAGSSGETPFCLDDYCHGGCDARWFLPSTGREVTGDCPAAAPGGDGGEVEGEGEERCRLVTATAGAGCRACLEAGCSWSADMCATDCAMDVSCYYGPDASVCPRRKSECERAGSLGGCRGCTEGGCVWQGGECVPECAFGPLGEPIAPCTTGSGGDADGDGCGVATCTLSDRETVVQAGWSGRDAGDNWCNRCFCGDRGMLACTEMACLEQDDDCGGRMRGDVDGNGAFGIADAISCVQFATGLSAEAQDPCGFWAADVDGSGSVMVTDVLAIVRRILLRA